MKIVTEEILKSLNILLPKDLDFQTESVEIFSNRNFGSIFVRYQGISGFTPKILRPSGISIFGSFILITNALRLI